MKICSLLPGATEVVAALGLADDVVGVSHECDYPPAMRRKPVMVKPAIDAERTSSPDIDRQVRGMLDEGRHLYALDEALFTRAEPDLVITQDLCQVCAITPGQLQRAINALAAPPVLLTLNPTSLEDIFTDVERIGAAAGRAGEGTTLAAGLRARLQAIRHRVASVQERPRVVCLEWLDPLYIGGHWVPEMVDWAGGRDALGRAGEPSKQVTWEQVEAATPDVVVLMPCGFSVARTLKELDEPSATQPWPDRTEWATLPAVRQGRVYVVDAASYFSRPGPRLVDGVAILAALLHPGLFNEGERPLPAQALHLPLSRRPVQL